MTDLQAAREAAERLRRIHKGECYLSVYGGGTGWMQNDPNDPYNVDMRLGFGLLLAVLADPTVLLKPPEWEPHPKRPNCWWWATILGEYYAEPPLNNGETEWDWRLSGEPWREAPSLAAAQAAAEADYRERMRGAFQETKTAPGA